MPIVEPLKFDIRVRDRLLRKGQINDSEVKKHLDSLTDVGDKFVELELKQPALQKDSERAEYARISRPSPIARPAPIRPFDEEDEADEDLAVPPVDEDEDDEDEDDLDDDETPAKAAKPAAANADEEVTVIEGAKKAVDDDWGTEP